MIVNDNSYNGNSYNGTSKTIPLSRLDMDGSSVGVTSLLPTVAAGVVDISWLSIQKKPIKTFYLEYCQQCFIKCLHNVLYNIKCSTKTEDLFSFRHNFGSVSATSFVPRLPCRTISPLIKNHMFV